MLSPVTPRVPFPAVADVVSYAAVEFRERAEVKRRQSVSMDSGGGGGRWSKLNSVSKAKWMDASLDTEDDREVLASRLVFYEKLFFLVDAADGDCQGCASRSTARSSAPRSLRPAPVPDTHLTPP